MLIIFRVRLYAHSKFKEIFKIPAQSTAGVKKNFSFQELWNYPPPPIRFLDWVT